MKRQPSPEKPVSPFVPALTPRELVALAVILVVALVVRVPGLNDSLWFDEIWYTRTIFANPQQLAFVLWEDVHPPAYPILLLAWTELFGDSEISVRIPSMLFGFGSLLLLWFIARRWVGPFQALLVTALLALSPPHIWYSYENKVNMMLLLVTLYTVWLFWRAVETRLTRDWISASLVMIVALHTHAYAVPVGAAIFTWLAWRAIHDRTLVKPMLVSACGIALAFAPMALLKYGQRDELGRGYLRQLSPAEVYKLLLIWLPNGNTLRTVSPYSSFSRLFEQPWPYFLIEAFYAVLLGRGLLVLGRRAYGGGWLKPVANPELTEPARLVLLWIIMPLIATAAGSLLSEHFYIERNLLVILPPFLLLLVAGAVIETPRWAQLTMIAGMLTLAMAATVSLRMFKTEEWTVYKYKPDWRSLANYFSSEIAAHGQLRVLVSTPTYEFAYYERRLLQPNAPSGRQHRHFVADVCDGDPAKIVQDISRMNWPSVYLLENKTWDGCADRVWEAFSNSQQLRLVEEREFKGLRVYKFSP